MWSHRCVPLAVETPAASATAPTHSFPGIAPLALAPQALLAFIRDQGIDMSEGEFDDATDEGAETGDLVEHRDGRYRLATQVTSKRECERDAARTAAAAASKKKKKKKKSKAQKTKAGKSVGKGKSNAAKKVPAAAGLRCARS